MVVLIGFGGPRTPEEVRPFVVEVLGGRRVPPHRIDEVVAHYQQVGGRSPYVEESTRLGRAIAGALVADGLELPVVTGHRYGEPRLEAQISDAVARGARRLVAIAMTPWDGREAGDRYRSSAASAIGRAGATELEIVWVPAFHGAEGFLDGWADRIRFADPEGRCRLLFTAHSVPSRSSEPYRSQIETACGRIAGRLGRPGDWSLAWQSRSGDPEEPWLGPDVLEVLDRLASRGREPVLAVPVGFLCEHVEILYDLGVDATARAAALGLPFRVAPAISDHPLLARHLARAVEEALA